MVTEFCYCSQLLVFIEAERNAVNDVGPYSLAPVLEEACWKRRDKQDPETENVMARMFRVWLNIHCSKNKDNLNLNNA